MRKTKTYSHPECGSAFIEYVILVALIAVASIPIVKNFSENTQYQLAALDIELGGGTEGAGGPP